jgi:hypothetical protein
MGSRRDGGFVLFALTRVVFGLIVELRIVLHDTFRADSVSEIGLRVGRDEKP